MTLEEIIAPIVAENAELERKKAQKAEQARINGAKSRGPVTAAGKARSSRNAIRHGMTANEHTVLEAESLEEYDEVRSAFIDQFHPATKAELRLVEKIANIDWRLERLAMMETSLIDMRADFHLPEIRKNWNRMDGIGIVVLSWLEDKTPSKCSELLCRYIGTLDRQLDTSIKNLRTLKKDRVAEAMAGDKFDQPPYQVPEFNTLLKSQLVEPLSYDEVYAEVESPTPPSTNEEAPAVPSPAMSESPAEPAASIEVEPTHQTPPPVATPSCAHSSKAVAPSQKSAEPPSPPALAPSPNEPMSINRINRLQPINKRPAA